VSMVQIHALIAAKDSTSLVLPPTVTVVRSTTSRTACVELPRLDDCVIVGTRCPDHFRFHGGQESVR
jgi:hypothetical protein